MDTLITPEDVIGRDPIGRFLFRLKFKPWQAALLSFSMFALYMFALPAYHGTLLPAAGLDRSSMVDRVNMVGFLFIHPVVICFYVWQPGALAAMYRKVLPLLPVDMHGGALRASRIAHATSRLWLLGALVGVGVMALGFNYVVNFIGIRWYSYNWMMAIILQFSRFLLFYLIVLSVVRHLVMAFNLNRIYRHVKIPVLIGQSRYSDSFEAVTHYGLWFTGFGGALGMFIAMRFFWGKPLFPEDAIYLTIYLLLIPLAFSLPFWQAHRSMRLARLNAIRQISDSLQDEYDRLTKDMAKDNVIDQESQIVTLRSMLDLTEKAPTWPFENWDVYRVIAATFFPFVMTGVGVLLDLLI
jgi:hypothetical protein